MTKPCICAGCNTPYASEIPSLRPSWDVWFLRIAYVVAQRGTCPRKQVGCVVVDNASQSILSTGYNGAPRGLPHCTQVGCDLEDIAGRPSCVRTLHAESNALDRVVTRSPSMTLYSTVIPCHRCALRVVQFGGILRVIYHDGYRSQSTDKTSGLFRDAGIALVRIDGPTEIFSGTWTGDPPLAYPTEIRPAVAANRVAMSTGERQFVEGDTPEQCAACGKNVSRHFGGIEYRCDPRQDSGEGVIVAQDAVFGDGDGWG